jgi:predicted enzyme involved in methoxymalonyl-ACP biosynthesis
LIQTDVAVPALPDDPALFAGTLLSAGYFEPLGFTGGDRMRNEQYRAKALRASVANQMTDLAGCLRSLNLTIDFRPFRPVDRACDQTRPRAHRRVLATVCRPDDINPG